MAKFNTDWITEGVDEACVQFMEDFGLRLCDKQKKDDRFTGRNAVTTSQMRNIFSEVKRIEVKLVDDKAWLKERANVLLLRPKIAYSTARAISDRRDSKMQELREVLETALSAIEGPAHFKRFAQFFEGLIAYHKVYGGQ